jgi:aminoglycoside/choline kinase family phosphotransferase
MHKIKKWLDQIGWKAWQLERASEDASFRRYFRLTKGGTTAILMDASLEKEALVPFLDVTARLLNAGVNAPKILEQEPELGYLILEDFGSVHYLDLLNATNFESLYMKAIETIVKMQQSDPSGLPLYDKAFLRFEMELMPEWFLKKYLKLELSDTEDAMIDRTLDAIADVVLEQPQGLFVHRDYHSRNMLLTPDGRLGVIDYQDAMSGALTYDLVSLLKDCYIHFEQSEIEHLALKFRDLKGVAVDDATFLRWFDMMGLQRHIKVLGIFARLWLRDSKPGYLKDLPLTLRYAVEAAERYAETAELAELLKKVRLP